MFATLCYIIGFFIDSDSSTMKLPVLICDDSALARRQMAKALPSNWDIELSFACNGQEAMKAIEAGQAHLMFLDLNMPVMSGYEVLEQIHQRDLQSMVLVVSGDVQPEAYARVMAKGALDFIRKPVTAAQIAGILTRYGIMDATEHPYPQPPAMLTVDELPVPMFLEALKEVVNVAMGQAGSHLGILFGSFIHLPVPDVFICSYRDVVKHLAHLSAPSGVAHGFNGNGVAGEGILLLQDRDISQLHCLMQRDRLEPDQSDSSTITGVLSDLSELLVGACLKGISQQLDIEFNHSYPALLGIEQEVSTLLDCADKQESVLAVSISYHLSEPDIHCHLLLLFTEDSIAALQSRVELLSYGKAGES